MLNCWWQKPYLDNERSIRISWYHKLVSFNELLWDEESKELYYYDSEKDFYNLLSDNDKQKYDQWESEINKRWDKIFDDIAIRKQEQEVKERDLESIKEKIEQFKELYKKVLNGDMSPEAFQNSENLWGFKIGNFMTVKPKYREIQNYKNGLACVKIASWGCIDLLGKKIIPFQYSDMKLTNECVIACNRQKCWGTLDYQGNSTIPFEYIELEIFEDGYLKVNKNHKWGILDIQGNIIIPFEYNKLIPFTEETIKAAKGHGYFDDVKWGILDKSGGVIIPFEYDEIVKFKDENTKLRKDSLWEEIDSDWNYIISNISTLSNGLKKGRRFDKWAILNIENKAISSFEFNDINSFNDDYIMALKGKWGILDIQGNIIIPFEYNELIPFTEETIKAAKGHGYFDDVKWGILDKSGDVIIPFEFNDIEEFEDGYLKVRKNYKWGILDKSGGVIIPFEYDEIVKFKDENTKLRKDSFKEMIRGRKGMFWKTILLASKISLGEKHEGVITDILSFGLIVKIKNYTTGLLHITEIRKKGWNIRDFKIGDTINVQVISLDNNKLRFTLEVIPFIVGEKHAGTIINIKPFGLFVKVKGHEVGLVHKTEISKSMKSIQDFRVGDIITVKVKYVDKEKNKANFGIVL